MTNYTDIDKDLGFLTIYNSGHTDYLQNQEELDTQLKEIALKNFSSLIDGLLSIKTEKDEHRDLKKISLQIHDFDKTEFTIALPEPRAIFPRFRPLPTKKQLTKWERYKKDRGFQTRKKKSKLVYDEVTKDWVYRYGSKGIKHIHDKINVVREVPHNQNPFVDPFEKEKLQKKLKQQKQEMSQIKNKMRAKGLSVKDAMTHDQKMQRLKQKRETLKKVKLKKKFQLKDSLKIAQNSTASMGKFDQKAHKEEVRRIIKKKSQKINIRSAKGEVARNKEMLRLLLQK